MNSLRGISRKIDAVLLLVMVGLCLALILAWNYYQTRKMTGYEKDVFAAELLAYDLPEQAAAILEESISRQPYSEKSLKMRQALADIYMKELHQFEKALAELVFLRTFSLPDAAAIEDNIRYCLNRLGRSYDVDRRKLLAAGENPVANNVASDTVIRIGNRHAVSLEDVHNQLRVMNIDPKSIDKARLDAVVQAMAREKLLHRAAERENVERDPDYIKQIRQFENNLRLKLYLEKHVLREAKISDAELQDFISRNRERFSQPDRVRFSAYAFSDAAAAEIFIRNRQEGAEEEMPPYEVMTDRSEVPIGQLPVEIRSLDFKVAEKIEYFGPMRVNERYLVYQIHSHTQGEKLPAAQIEEFARRSLIEEKQQQLLASRIAELAGKEEMKINEEVLKKEFFPEAKTAEPETK